MNCTLGLSRNQYCSRQRLTHHRMRCAQRSQCVNEQAFLKINGEKITSQYSTGSLTDWEKLSPPINKNIIIIKRFTCLDLCSQAYMISLNFRTTLIFCNGCHCAEPISTLFQMLFLTANNMEKRFIGLKNFAPVSCCPTAMSNPCSPLMNHFEYKLTPCPGHYVQTSRHRYSHKYITYRNAAKSRLSQSHG